MRGLPTRAGAVVKMRASRDEPDEREGQTPASGNGAMQIDGASRLVRFPVVRQRTGLSRSTIWRMERRGEFPRHHRISSNVVAWLEEEVSGWIRARVAGE
jgi:prophage regulatory protein